jgi:hypothetical protein
MNLILAGALVATAGASWWLSSFDPGVLGTNPKVDLRRRWIRCAITLVIVWVAGSLLQSGGRGGGFVYIALVVPLALVWASCVSELFTRLFQQLVDPADNRQLEPGRATRELDYLGELVKGGLHKEVIQLCAELLKSGEVSALALDTLLFQTYQQMFTDERLMENPTLAEAHQLREAGRTLEAEAHLQNLLRAEPKNLAGMMMLLRCFSLHPASHNKARDLLRSISNCPDTPPGFHDFAEKAFRDWTHRGSEAGASDGVESLLVDPKKLAPKKTSADSD